MGTAVEFGLTCLTRARGTSASRWQIVLERTHSEEWSPYLVIINAINVHYSLSYATWMHGGATFGPRIYLLLPWECSVHHHTAQNRCQWRRTQLYYTQVSILLQTEVCITVTINIDNLWASLSLIRTSPCQPRWHRAPPHRPNRCKWRPTHSHCTAECILLHEVAHIITPIDMDNLWTLICLTLASPDPMLAPCTP
jgi:hypothetical protein